MRQEQWDKQLEQLRRGRLELRSTEGKALVEHVRGAAQDAYQMREALVSAVITLQRKNEALKLLCETANRGQKIPGRRRVLEVRWKDGSVTQIDADGYEIEAIGDGEYIVPYRVERVDEEPISMTDEWASVSWRPTAPDGEEAPTE